MGAIGDLNTIADLVLQSCAEALDTVHADDASLLGAPSRQFVSPGAPVLDCCDQLTVHVQLINSGQTSPGGLAGGKSHRYGLLNHVTMLVTSTRCIPDGFDLMGNYSAPDPAELDAAAEQLNADAWALWNHLYNLQSSGLLRSLCDEVFLDGVNALVPSGGCAGWLYQLRFALDGYTETLST